VHANVYSIIQLNDKEITALCEYRKIKMPDEERVSRNADIEVATSLRNGLQALGFQPADIARGSTRLTRLICETLGIGLEPYERICRKRANSNEQLRSDQTVVRSSD
jgi:hypothetical protein